MSGTSIAIIGTVVLVVLGALVLFGASRRRDARPLLSRETVRKDVGGSEFLEPGPTGREVERAAQSIYRQPGTDVEPVAETAPVPFSPVDPETLGVTRRQFFNRGMVTMMSVSLGGFGASMLAFLWPGASTGFGSTVSAGSIDDVLATIEQGRQPLYVAEGRFFLAHYPQEAIEKAQAVYGAELDGMEAGLVALYQKCVHLGCRVPFCTTSQWFECGCHGSQYNRVGEQKGGPAPRGLDRFPVDTSGGRVSVNTGVVIIGPPKGTNTTGQEAEGPHCISLAGEH
ncbi:MAG: ubiquinol-cytochrome c reductase iron-sulfur subunit [Acidimicrobiia bacterium]